MSDNQSHNRVLRLPDVIQRVGIKRASIYRMMSEGAFPKPVQLGPRAVGWRASDIERWISQRPAARA